MELDQNRSMWSCFCKHMCTKLSGHDTATYPVLDLAMSDGVMETVSRTRGCINCVVADEKVQIFCPSLRGKMTPRVGPASQEGRFVGDGRSAGARARARTGRTSGGYRGREDKGWGIVTGESYESQA